MPLVLSRFGLVRDYREWPERLRCETARHRELGASRTMQDHRNPNQPLGSAYDMARNCRPIQLPRYK
jgi:hypothetical protein